MNEKAFQFKRKDEVNPFDVKVTEQAKTEKPWVNRWVFTTKNGYMIYHHSLYGYIPVNPIRFPGKGEVEYFESEGEAIDHAMGLESVEDYRHRNQLGRCKEY